MIQLKEALIGKKNAKDAKSGVNDKNVIWVLKSHNTYIDIYLMKHGVKTSKTKDGITLYILTNGQLSQYWKHIESYDSVTMVVKDPSMSMKEVENYIKSHEYKYRAFNDAFSFEDFNEFISESLIGRHNEKSFSGIEEVYCMAVARNDIQSEILNDKDTEYYTWDHWGVLFIPNDRIQYWIDYCKKEIPRNGWWAGKIHTDSRQKAKKMLLRSQDIQDVIEKIDGPSVI